MQMARTTLGPFETTILLHPQGCRTYLVKEPESGEALVLDPHLDAVPILLQAAVGSRVRWIVDSHTHADHPSGAGALAALDTSIRVAHAKSRHAGVTHLPDDGESLSLGDRSLTVRHTPGHTPDHLVLEGEGLLFSGDSLLIGSVARADFIGGDAGALYDSIHDVMLPLEDDTILLPGHDYEGQTTSTVGVERASNAWLRIEDRDEFVKLLSANTPPEPANMPTLLSLNREGVEIPTQMSGEQLVQIVEKGGAGSVIDVRTQKEVEQAHVPGTRAIPMDQIPSRLRDVLATPAPRMLLCHTGQRSEAVRRWLVQQGISGVTNVSGGIVGYARARGRVVGGKPAEIATAGGCAAGGCAAPGPGA
jgi:glyoxylase-like metal-dependent hydrolase (beta-lactamase superfamily II)/rhodanese-related sulfurtransferase